MAAFSQFGWAAFDEGGGCPYDFVGDGAEFIGFHDPFHPGEEAVDEAEIAGWPECHVGERSTYSVLNNISRSPSISAASCSDG